jgi:hypothetical protein
MREISDEKRCCRVPNSDSDLDRAMVLPRRSFSS